MIPYNAKEVVALLTAPPFALGRPGTAGVEVASKDSILLFGAGEYVEDAVRALTDKNSSWMRQLARRRIMLQQVKQSSPNASNQEIELKIVQR